MSDFDSNPFADPDLNNPFKDPSVTQVTRNVPPGLDEYNPFSDSRTVRITAKVLSSNLYYLQWETKVFQKYRWTSEFKARRNRFDVCCPAAA